MTQQNQIRLRRHSRHTVKSNDDTVECTRGVDNGIPHSEILSSAYHVLCVGTGQDGNTRDSHRVQYALVGHAALRGWEGVEGPRGGQLKMTFSLHLHPTSFSLWKVVAFVADSIERRGFNEVLSRR